MTKEQAMEYTLEEIRLKTITKNEIELLEAYLLRNREFLKEWEPIREDSYYEKKQILKRIEEEQEERDKQTGINLYIFPKEEEKIIGNVHIDSIARGVFQSCFLGYKLDESYINRGYMTMAVQKAIQIAFEDYKLHRIEANIMPENIRSQKVVKKLGFEAEGISKKYLKINGKWQDHIHYVKLNEKVEG